MTIFKMVLIVLGLGLGFNGQKKIPLSPFPCNVPRVKSFNFHLDVNWMSIARNWWPTSMIEVEL